MVITTEGTLKLQGTMTDEGRVWLDKLLSTECNCTLCQWTRMKQGRRAKPRARRPKFAVAWLWKVIDRQ